jgi:hypothetical protein
MFPLKKFRVGMECDFMNSFDNYIRRNYPLDVFNQCKGFINDLSQTRNSISYLSANTTESMIDSLLSKCVSYIKTLLELNTIVSIEPSVLKINFSWREACKDQVTVSNNLYYEICSVKYNIAILLMGKGYIEMTSKDKNILKEAYKNFIQAAGLFEEITTLCNKYYVTRENIPDFSENLLYTCKSYALGMAQIAIFLISDGKYGPDLLLKLAYGAYILLNRALSTSICIVDDRGEIDYLARYYLVKALLLAKNTYVNNYNERGRDIGIILGLDLAILEHLKKIDLNKNKYGTHEQNSAVTNLLRIIQSDYEQYKYKNDLVNKEKIDARDVISSLPSVIKAQIPEKKYDLDVSPLASLNQIKRSLIQPYIRPMIDRYVSEMRKYVDGNIYNIETPEKIDDFINKRGLNDIFGYYGGSSVLSNEVFRDIQEIQAQGGLGGLLEKFKYLNNEFHNIQNKINNIKDFYSREEMENDNYKRMYGDKWNLPLDPSYKNVLDELLGELNNKRKSDIEFSGIIMNDKSFYDLLKFKEKAEIEAKIPKDMSELKLQSSPLVEGMQKNVNVLFEKKSIMLDLLNKLYSRINNEWPLDDFNQVHRKLKTEAAILQEQKDAVLNNLKEIEKLSGEIVNLYPLIEKDYNEYVKQTGFKGNVVNNKYLQFFNNLKTNYQRQALELDRRLQEYYGFAKKVDDVGKNVNDHIQARNFAKSEILENLEHEFRVKMAQNTKK